MEVLEVLNRIGLTYKESAVYLALLELGTATVHPIAAKAGIKRPTTYLILDQLQQKGMVSVIPRVKKALYTAESPEKLAGDLKKKEELLKSSLPNLLALYNAKKEKPQVQLFEGIEGIKQVYDKIFAGGEVWFFGTAEKIMKIDFQAALNFLRRSAQQGIKVRDLLSQSQENYAYAREAQKSKTYELRFVPKDMNFPTDSAIFGDSVVFFSFRPQIFAVLLTSSEIAQSLRALHQLAWLSAEPFQQQKIALIDD